MLKFSGFGYECFSRPYQNQISIKHVLFWDAQKIEYTNFANIFFYIVRVKHKYTLDIWVLRILFTHLYLIKKFLYRKIGLMLYNMLNKYNKFFRYINWIKEVHSNKHYTLAPKWYALSSSLPLSVIYGSLCVSARARKIVWGNHKKLPTKENL